MGDIVIYLRYLLDNMNSYHMRLLDPRFPPTNLCTSALSHPPPCHVRTLCAPPQHSVTNTSPPCSSRDLRAHGALPHHRQHVTLPSHRYPCYPSGTQISTSPSPSSPASSSS